MTRQALLGKFRGVVVDNADPLRMGRVQALVPDAGGDAPSTWALPCLPLAAAQLGLFAAPPIGARVWIEYEHGDLDRPIWTGCFWDSVDDVPPGLVPAAPRARGLALVLPNRTTVAVGDEPGGPAVRIETAGGASLTVTDDEITLQTAGGARLSLGAAGLRLESGRGASVTLDGITINLNDGALKID